MKEIVIYGAGSFAKMMRLYLDRIPGQKVVSFCVDKSFMCGETLFDNLPLLAFESVERHYPVDRFMMFVAVGYSKMRARVLMYERARLKGYQFVSYIDNKANIDETAIVGDNNVFLAGSVVEPFVRIGDNNIIWSSVVISHDVKIGSHCFIASQSLIAGNCTVEDNVFFGFNSVCLQGTKIKRESLIGAKSLILFDTEEFSRNIGSPAKKISTHKDTGIVVK